MSIRNLFDEEVDLPAEEPAPTATPPAETAVVPVAPSDVVVFQDYARVSDVPGLEEFDSKDIIMPRRKLVQATTRDVEPAVIGQYLDGLSGEAKKSVDAIVLRYSHTRAMFKEGVFSGEGLVCASNDGRTPRPQIAEPPSHVCEDCPMAVWGNDGEKPACRAGYTFLMIDTADDSPFMITFAGTAIRPAKKLISNVALKRRPFYAFRVRISSEMKQDDRGKWYAPVFAAVPMDPKKDAAEINRYADLFRGYAAVQLEADESIAEAEATDAGNGNGSAAPF